MKTKVLLTRIMHVIDFTSLSNLAVCGRSLVSKSTQHVTFWTTQVTFWTMLSL